MIAQSIVDVQCSDNSCVVKCLLLTCHIGSFLQVSVWDNDSHLATLQCPNLRRVGLVDTPRAVSIDGNRWVLPVEVPLSGRYRAWQRCSTSS